jgi:hypothetical protein
VTYIGNTIQKHGVDLGKSPTATVLLDDGEQISSIFGTVDLLIRSIGFATTSGAIYGPWGKTDGSVFSINGPVYGFYGGLWDDVLGKLGIWTTDPPIVPTPTPSPNPSGVMRSRMFGGASFIDSRWDDGANFAGKPHSLNSMLRSACISACTQCDEMLFVTFMRWHSYLHAWSQNREARVGSARGRSGSFAVFIGQKAVPNCVFKHVPLVDIKPHVTRCQVICLTGSTTHALIRICLSSVDISGVLMNIVCGATT